MVRFADSFSGCLAMLNRRTKVFPSLWEQGSIKLTAGELYSDAALNIRPLDLDKFVTIFP